MSKMVRRQALQRHVDGPQSPASGVNVASEAIVASNRHWCRPVIARGSTVPNRARRRRAPMLHEPAQREVQEERPGFLGGLREALFDELGDVSFTEGCDEKKLSVGLQPMPGDRGYVR